MGRAAAVQDDEETLLLPPAGENKAVGAPLRKTALKICRRRSAHQTSKPRLRNTIQYIISNGFIVEL